MFGKRLSRALAVTAVLSLVMTAVAFASDANMAIADTTAPTGSVELAPSGDASIVITVTVTGAQAGTSSYKVYKDWTLDAAGTWTGTNEATSASVGPRAGGDAANVQTFAGKVFIASDAACDVYSLTVGVHGVTNSNTTGGKLQAGSSSTYSVTVSNCSTPNDPPILTLPTSMTVEGNTIGGADVTYTGISASDTEDGDLTSSVVCDPASGSFFALGGPYTVDCSVEDSDGASDGGSFSVTVADTTGPDVTAPDDITVEGDTAGGALQTTVLGALGTGSASDIVWGDVSSSVNISSVLPAVFPMGLTPITYTATDGSSNTGSDTTTVTVEDTTDPVISGMPGNISTTTMNPAGKAVSWTAPTASDIVDSDVAVNCSPASGSTFAIGTTTVTCTAADDSGNSAQASFDVTVGLLSALWKEPINGPSVINVAKAGRVIPVKVELFLNGVENVDTGTVTFRLYKSNTCTAGSQDAIEAFMAAGDANSGDLFRWDSTGGFYIYNLKTPSTTGCYSGEVLLNGERAGYFLINLTK